MEVPNARLICAAIRGQPQLALRFFMSTTARMMSAAGPFGPGFTRRFGEKQLIFPLHQSAMKIQQRGGLQRNTETGQLFDFEEEGTESGDQAIRRPEIRSTTASAIQDSNCCFIRTDSAITDRTPPGRTSRTIVTTTCSNRASRSRIQTSYQRRTPAPFSAPAIRHGQDSRKSTSSIWTAPSAVRLHRTGVMRETTVEGRRPWRWWLQRDCESQQSNGGCTSSIGMSGVPSQRTQTAGPQSSTFCRTRSSLS
jgi:hypothetical protein